MQKGTLMENINPDRIILNMQRYIAEMNQDAQQQAATIRAQQEQIAGLSALVSHQVERIASQAAWIERLVADLDELQKELIDANKTIIKKNNEMIDLHAELWRSGR
jgi:septal ring factor EnvC (AmiA/AmiB activator)